ncbi:MAG: hypothetical protein KKH61_20005 [Gammaproteobacteria bacterium]|nr:hypothetical protein [Gammaproteobacteria bacterium]
MRLKHNKSWRAQIKELREHNASLALYCQECETKVRQIHHIAMTQAENMQRVWTAGSKQARDAFENIVHLAAFIAADASKMDMPAEVMAQMEQSGMAVFGDGEGGNDQ